MNTLKIALLFLSIFMTTSCASGYKMIKPERINYLSANESDGIKLEYKYSLLDKKYEKNEFRKGIQLVALKITNNSGQDIIFGKDVKLAYENGTETYVMENEKTFELLKQSPTSYLWYLLLTPMTFNVTKTNTNGFQETTSSSKIGFILGPGLAGGNMIAAGAANKKFKEEIFRYNLNGTTIKNRETKYGLIGIKSNSFEGLKLKIK